MSPRPLLLDLFCGAGGAAVGYHRAGFDVIGVDINPQPRYPFEFHQADALTYPLAGFDAIHASPPCQDYSLHLRGLVKPGKYGRLIESVRERLIGVPYVIENVIGAPLPSQDTLDGAHGLMLCGTMFGIRVRRHRLFESSHPCPAPRKGCDHSRRTMNIYDSGSREWMRQTFGPNIYELWRQEIGADWMNGHEASEAIPPVYTEYIGTQLLADMKLSHS